MQVQDEHKRRRIRQVAANLFAERPFEAVRLEEVARRAGVGKGTLYTYYASKDELYLAVLVDGFAALVKGMKRQMRPSPPAPTAPNPAKTGVTPRRIRRPVAAKSTPTEALALLIDGLLTYAYRHPHMFTLLRSLPLVQVASSLEVMRKEMEQLIEAVIRRGVAEGEWYDAEPMWTAQYIPGMIRSVLMYGGKRPRKELLARHLLQILTGGLQRDDTHRSVSRPTGSTKRVTHHE